MDQYIKDILGENGLLAQTIPNYEHRESQIAMAKLVGQSLCQDSHGVIEAGTGVGKSFAYLLPAIKFAVENKKRVVVSTKTINLQEQLMKKDIPLLQSILPDDLSFSAVLAKGRGNYLCLRKLEQHSQVSLLDNPQLKEELNYLHFQSIKAQEGDREEFKSSRETWEKVCSEADSCLKKFCSHLEKCFFYQARKRQEKAQILVVNHALFFADLAIRRNKNYESNSGAFADYHSAILDEAHHVENIATDFLGIQINYLRFKYLLDAVSIQVNSRGPLGDILGRNNRIFEKFHLFLKEFNDQAVAFFQKVADYFQEDSKRLSPQDKCFVEDSLTPYLSTLAEELEMIRDGYPLSEEYVIALNNLLSRVDILRHDLDFFLFQRGREHYVYWLENGKNRDNKLNKILLACAPISVAEIMQEAIFERIPSVILTSATLSINNVFHYFTDRIGLEENYYQGLQLSAPFAYQKQALLYLPNDAPDPRHPKFEQYITEKILQILLLSQGRAFILFTSYRSMSQVYDTIGYQLEQLGYTPLIQGQKNRAQLLQDFKADINSVLFGTDSFWEGVDVQGEALSCVIIVKLPFAVPDQPITQARCEYLEKLEKNPFLEYSLPQAVIKLKQGFGRLVRTKEDKGVVAILDNRIAKAYYGKTFLKSLPPAKITRNINEIRNLLQD